jgi:hypothetical protein
VKIILKNNKEIKQNSRSQPALHEMLRKFYRLKRSKIDLNSSFSRRNEEHRK